MISKLRSLIFLFGYYFVIGLIITPLMLFPTLLFPYRAFRYVVKVWCHIILWWARVSAGIKFEVNGAEHLEALKGSPHVIIANHQSAYETLLFSYLLPDHVFILKKELLKIPFVGWGLRKTGQIAIDRKDGRRALQNIIKQSKIAFAEGRSIVIFPEGTRVPVGREVRYQSGGFAIAEALQAPILPIAHNAGLAWPKTTWVKSAGTITVNIGKPISSIDKSSRELKEESEKWIRQHIEQELKA